MKQGFFITGTDTGVGKTWFTVRLMQHLQEQGLVVNGMKPIASGAERQGNKLINDDAVAIHQACSSALNYSEVNPLVYAPPVAPHIAAQKSGRPINVEVIVETYNHLQRQSDLVVVEGVGGWRVPLDDTHSLGYLVAQLQLPVILVVGLRLGCINHALLSAEAVQHDGLPLAGWVVSHLEKDYLYKQETLATIERALDCPLLGELAHTGSGRLEDAVLNMTAAAGNALRF